MCSRCLCPRRRYAWEKLSVEQLLKQRLSSLSGRGRSRTWLEDCIKHSPYGELQERGIRLRPRHTWISSEWFSPRRCARHCHSILSCPSPPDEAREENDARCQRGAVLGSECMAILRHEAGHAVQHAYQLQRRRRWQQLFGPSTSKHYPLLQAPIRASRQYVQHLRLWYAQSHPDEDFAETFAVWLRPRSNWRTRQPDAGRR